MAKCRRDGFKTCSTPGQGVWLWMQEDVTIEWETRFCNIYAVGISRTFLPNTMTTDECILQRREIVALELLALHRLNGR
jgi:hypothetical protein